MVYTKYYVWCDGNCTKLHDSTIFADIEISVQDYIKKLKDARTVGVV